MQAFQFIRKSPYTITSNYNRSAQNAILIGISLFYSATRLVQGEFGTLTLGRLTDFYCIDINTAKRGPLTSLFYFSQKLI